MQTTGQDAPPQVPAAFGTASAVASTAATFPLEVVRRRAMVGMASHPNPAAAIAGIVAKEGLGALYKVGPSSTHYAFEIPVALLNVRQGDFILIVKSCVCVCEREGGGCKESRPLRSPAIPCILPDLRYMTL